MQISDDIKPKVEALFAKTGKTLATHLGIEYVSMDKARVVATMPVDERTKQPFGLLHGGASVALSETLASIGAWLNVDETRFDVVGMEINANHLRAVRSGSVTGEATPIHRGASTQVWEIKIVEENLKLVCISRCTLAVVKVRGK